MDIEKYRKWYLEDRNNLFTMVKFGVEFKELRIWKNNRIVVLNFGRNHPFVLAEKAFWVNDRELCIGYQLCSNTSIFRPIFSYKRQRLLDQVHVDIKCPTAFWRAVKMRYYICMSQLKILPLQCVAHIVHFI